MLVICGKHTEAHTVISKIHQHIDGLSGHDSDRNILFFLKVRKEKQIVFTGVLAYQHP